jgi:2-phosphoglycerate kinase
MANFGYRDEETNSKRNQEHYLDHFEEIRMVQSFILERAEVEGVTVMETRDRDEMLNAALDLVLNAVLTNQEQVTAPEVLLTESRDLV